jgi:hypothetical protein
MSLLFPGAAAAGAVSQIVMIVGGACVPLAWRLGTS